MENGPYITARRARFLAICGPVNIPWGTPVIAVDGVLLLGLRLLCATTSQNAHDFFARNDDGDGVERGTLTAAIADELARKNAGHANRWKKVWRDPVCQKYRRPEHADFWQWSHDFYEAPVEDLRHIAGLIGAARGVR